LFLLTLAVIATCTADAQLVGTSFGFPTMIQSGQTTAFNQDIATAFDNEAVNVGFPTATTGACGIGMAFPTVSQTAVQGQTLMHSDFAQTTENAAFSYPMVGVGTGLGFAGFGMGGFGSALGFC
jgi:hypothetical protein